MNYFKYLSQIETDLPKVSDHGPFITIIWIESKNKCINKNDHITNFGQILMLNKI